MISGVLPKSAITLLTADLWKVNGFPTAKKGENNKKNGNKYLAWAYVEAANFAKRYCSKAQRFYQSKKAKTKNVVAIKALSNKLSRASCYIMRDQVDFDEDKLFC